MWTCPKCGEKIEEQFETCPRGATPPSEVASEARTTPESAPAGVPAPVKWRAKYRMFRGTLATWDELFGEAGDFANEIGPERLITISHSEDRREGVVAVWYWADDNGERTADDLLRVAS